jgi:uncharacterized protein (DUF1800 family)
MTCPDPALPNLQRRAAMQALAAFACVGGSAALRSAKAQTASPAAGAAAPLNTNAQAWRAMARVGYGPTAALMRAVQAAPSPRAWALNQVDSAFQASQRPPRIAADLADFNAPLPRLFAGAQAERQSRAKGKADAPGGAKAADAAGGKSMDFSVARGPEHFSRTMVQQAAAWRLGSCSQPEEENPLLARMTEFWFNHLNVYVGKGAVRPFTGHYVVNVARAHALGKFEDLLLASARHPAMLLYLDQARSVAEGSRGAGGSTRGLNENYARELMELHTLGVDGGYAQSDVRELARVLTGWTVSPTDASGFQFTARLHDKGSKQVLGRQFPSGLLSGGEREGEEAIRMLARHPSTAKRISLRLALFFVSDTPSPELVDRLSRTFMDSQGDLRRVMRALLESADFWQSGNRLFKTPMDYACSALAATQKPGGPDRRNLVLTLGFLDNAGQPLHGWQTPDGYKMDAATWLVPEALTRRADYALSLARDTGEMDFLLPHLNAATRDTIAQERPAMRAGLMLASPDFMYK